MKLHVLSNARDHAKDRSLHSTHALIFGGKIIVFPVVDWQATGGEKLFTNITTRFRVLLYFFLRSNTMSTPLKVKRNTWSIAKEKDFLLLCKEKAITDLLDKCVTSAGVSRPF